MKLLTFSIILSIFTQSLFLQAKNDQSTKKVFESLINPVFAAKCLECHGENKSKGKLKLHTKEDFLNGGSGVGKDIIIKGNIEDSELIYRITLPKEDEEAMPPMEDSSHYNPVTKEELDVMKAWISLGASFDLLISDLDDRSRKSALHVLENMPKKLLPKSVTMQPKLPVVLAANPDVLESLRKQGILVMPIAQNTNAIYVNASYAGKDFNDEKLLLLEPLANQLLWLNLARTGVTDKGIASLTKHKLLSRLHLENTSLTDVATIHLSKLSNLEYLNLYGTEISDLSVPNLQKLSKLNKIFLWQTKMTPQGTDSLKKHFVNSRIYDDLVAQKNKMKTSLNNLIKSERSKLKQHEEKTKEISGKTADKDPLNEKCPVSKKALDNTNFSIFEGRKVGFCCDKCKLKFDAGGAVFRSKIPNFKASDEYVNSSKKLQNMRLAMDTMIETDQQKLRIINVQLNKMGPEINLGWEKTVSSK